MYKICFYSDSRGNEPVKDYIQRLNLKSHSNKNARVKVNKIYRTFELIEANGLTQPINDVSHLFKGLYEIRVSDDRVFFCYLKDKQYVMLHHCKKKKNKTPTKDKDMALKRMNEVKEQSK